MAKANWLRFAEILAVGQAFQPDGIICRLESLTCVTLAWTRLLIDRNGLPSGAPFRCAHRIAHRKRGPGQEGLRVGANLLGRNVDGSQIAWRYRTCAGHVDLWFRDGVKRQAGKCDCLPEFTSRPELSLRAARESGHNSMCQNGLKALLRATVRTKKRDSSAISREVAALKSAVSTPVRDCPALLAR